MLIQCFAKMMHTFNAFSAFDLSSETCSDNNELNVACPLGPSHFCSSLPIFATHCFWPVHHCNVFTTIVGTFEAHPVKLIWAVEHEATTLNSMLHVFLGHGMSFSPSKFDEKGQKPLAVLVSMWTGQHEPHICSHLLLGQRQGIC